MSPEYNYHHIILETISLNIPRNRRLEEKGYKIRSVDLKCDATSKRQKSIFTVRLVSQQFRELKFSFENRFKKDFRSDNITVIKGKRLLKLVLKFGLINLEFKKVAQIKRFTTNVDKSKNL